MRIFEYAKVANWNDRISDLVTLAEPERWEFISMPAECDYPVLDSYIKFTFRRIYDQNLIVESYSGQYACFNTGLLTPGQEEIFAVFSSNINYDARSRESQNNRKWFLFSWARAGDRILTDFKELPKLATYWNDSSDLVFNPNLEVNLNLDHIIRENLNRFPIELGGNVGENGIPSDIGATEPDEENEQIAAGPQNQVLDSQVPLATRNALEGSMKHSIRLAQRSYRIAVPQFHHNRIQLLLPLYLRSTVRPDLALTLEKHGGWYRAATVLYPDWAYRHARLLARPNSEWLGGFRKDMMN